MKPRVILLVVGVLGCVFAIVIVFTMGKPQDKVSFDSVMQVGESILHHIDRTGKVFTEVSDQEEVEIGNRMYKKWDEDRLLTGTPVDKYVNEVGQKVASNVKRKNIPYKFHVVKSKWPYAFAYPGGHIFISRGMLDKLGSESELASVLGHEITHVDAKHAIGLVQLKVTAEKLSGSKIDTFANTGFGLLTGRGYSEVSEEEADRGGTYLAFKAGYNPSGMIHALESFNRTSNVKNNTITPIGDTFRAFDGAFQRYYSTHPPTKDRIERVQVYISEEKLLKRGARLYVGEKVYKEKVYKQ